MKKAGLDEAQAGIEIAGRNTNNLTYTDDTTLTAESKEDPRNALMKPKEENEKAALTRWEGGSGWGIHVNPWLIHVNV